MDDELKVAVDIVTLNGREEKKSSAKFDRGMRL